MRQLFTCGPRLAVLLMDRYAAHVPLCGVDCILQSRTCNFAIDFFPAVYEVLLLLSQCQAIQHSIVLLFGAPGVILIREQAAQASQKQAVRLMTPIHGGQTPSEALQLLAANKRLSRGAVAEGVKDLIRNQ